jgi:hypothetical protein
MSRYYGMNVVIVGQDAGKVEAIKAAAEAEWPFENWVEGGGQLQAYGENQLCGGVTEEEFAERLTLAIWRANGAFCEVTVHATYMEELPYATYSLDEDDYARLIAGRGNGIAAGPSDESTPPPAQ